MNATLLIELDNFLKQNKLSLNNDDFDFITDINWKTPLNIKCLNCGCEFNITTKQLIRPHPERLGLVCPNCNTKELFENKLKSVFNGENPYILKNFKGYTQPVDVICKKCKHQWHVKAARNLLLKKEKPCKYCSKIFQEHRKAI